MNLKSIMTTAGIALLSFSLTGTAFAECTFVRATRVGDSCWAREDSCGNLSYIGGGCYTAYHKAHKKSKKTTVKARLELPKGTIFVPPDVPEVPCAKGAE